MKKVVNGKIYDTENATLIAEYAYGLNSNPGWETTALYYDPKGDFFIAGEGGPITRWGVSIGKNQWSEGSGIQVITNDEALRFAEQWEASPETIAQYFEVGEA